MSLFGTCTAAPADVILGLTTAFNECKAEDKVNLGVGAYRDNEGKPKIFKAVLAAEEMLLKEIQAGTMNKEYIPTQGHAGFIEECQKITLGDHRERFGTAQAIGGTGALRLGMEYVKVAIHGFDIEYPKKSPTYPNVRKHKVLVSAPTWPNHVNVAYAVGFDVDTYAYFDPKTLDVDEAGMLRDLETKLCKHDIVLLHAVGHNPTGADASPETMRKAMQLIQDRDAVCLMDIAYQGFVTGCLEQDRSNIVMALNEFPNMNLLIAQSFSKNMGMYGERLGAIHISAPTKELAKPVISQMNLVARRTYSSPPRHPGDIGYRVIKHFYKEWTEELKAVAERINEMRTRLQVMLKELCPNRGDWTHITKQKGMFAYTGLLPEETDVLKSQHSIYMTRTGRISIAGLNDGNIEKVAKAIASVCNENAAL